MGFPLLSFIAIMNFWASRIDRDLLETLLLMLEQPGEEKLKWLTESERECNSFP